jgi:hypothetical protein
MTCVPIPNGIVCLGGRVVRIMVGKRYMTFEDHPRFGPIRCNRAGDVSNNQFAEKSPFWPAYYKWVEQGKRVNEHGRAIVEDA